MAIRRRALELAGPFDESISGRGDEEDWERRYRARAADGVPLPCAARRARSPPDGADDVATAPAWRAAAYVQGRERAPFRRAEGTQPSLGARARER